MFPAINKKKTGINLRKIMDKRNLTVRDVQKYLGLGSVQSVYHWLNGITMPTIDNLYALSELFQIPVDALICGNRKMYEPDVISGMYDAQCRRILLYYLKIAECFLAAQAEYSAALNT